MCLLELGLAKPVKIIAVVVFVRRVDCISVPGNISCVMMLTEVHLQSILLRHLSVRSSEYVMLIEHTRSIIFWPAVEYRA